ncbi:MAG: 4Fe-4S dicluster domain-containing protein [Marinilabiliaceae bacterium]|nr:4Fe-4S dicluster domain-containing protein [Marinilabiliaceae bacterium]
MGKIRGAIVVDTAKCKGCSLCVEACPTKVIELSREVNAKGFHFAYMAQPQECTGCTNCATVCPDSCITVYRLKP